MFKHLFSKSNRDFRIYWNERFASTKFAHELFYHLPIDRNRPIVFICIGTDRSTGDSLGPLIGSLLQKKSLPSNFHVHGTLEDPIHAVNLEEKLLEIKKKYENPFYIGIDACLGQSQSVGSIQIKDEPVRPGAGVQKQLPPVGDIHITGIVNIGGFMEFFVLQNTRLHLVMNLAECISDGIYKTGLLYTREFERPLELNG